MGWGGGWGGGGCGGGGGGGGDGKLRAVLAPATTLFNESQSRIVISVTPENLEKTMSILQKGDVPHQRLGTVTGDELRIRANTENFRWPITDLYDDWWNSIRRLVESDSATERIPSL